MIDCQHIIWDWNGTLINDSWVCVEILNSLLVQYDKKTTTLEAYLKEFGFPVAAYYEHLGFDFSVDPFDTIADEYIEAYSTRQYQCSLHDHTVDVLSKIRHARMPQSILSAYQHEFLNEAVQKFEVAHFFEQIKGREDHFATSKVETGRELLDTLGLPPEQTVLIGDTLHDLEVAEALGMQCILVSQGHQCPERLSHVTVPVVPDLTKISSQIRTLSAS